MKICPDCRAELRSRLEPAPDGMYIELWYCIRSSQHGQTVECEHGCGEQVRNPREHYSFTSGLIGSGRWSCYPKRVTPDTCTHPDAKIIRVPERPVICGVCLTQMRDV